MTRLSSKTPRPLLVLAVAPLIAFGQSRQVEPTACTWKTWIICHCARAWPVCASAAGRRRRQRPIAWLREAVAQQDRALDQISLGRRVTGVLMDGLDDDPLAQSAAVSVSSSSVRLCVRRDA